MAQARLAFRVMAREKAVPPTERVLPTTARSLKALAALWTLLIAGGQSFAHELTELSGAELFQHLARAVMVQRGTVLGQLQPPCNPRPQT